MRLSEAKKLNYHDMEIRLEEALSKAPGFKDPAPEKTGIVHPSGAIREVTGHYKKQSPPLFVQGIYFSRPRLEFANPHYIVQRFGMTISPFWDELGDYSFPHNNMIRQTLPEIDYFAIKEVGQHENGELTCAYIIFEEKAGVLAKTKGRPLLTLQDPEFEMYLALLVSQVNGRADGIYEVRRILEVRYFPWIAGGGLTQWELQQSAKHLGKVPRTKQERTFWSSSVTDNKIEKHL